jgi:hypothetical protein
VPLPGACARVRRDRDHPDEVWISTQQSCRRLLLGLLKKLNKPQSPEVECEKDIFVWLKGIDYQEGRSIFPVRKYYYTALQGDQQRPRRNRGKTEGIGIRSPASI